MQTTHLITAIDTHTAGEPTRIVTDGLGWSSRNQTVREQTERFAAEHDWARRLLMQEPRGHSDMFGAIPVEPAADADLGLVFLTHDGVGEMCGHAIMGVVSAFIETGRLDPKSELRIETPVGISTVRPEMDGDRVDRVAVRSPPSFVYDHLTVDVGELGEIPVDVVYSGIFFAMVDVSDVGLEIERSNADALAEHGLALRAAVNDALDVVHPLTGDSRRVILTEFYQARDPVDRSFVVLADGSIDRSPCGTGTCAKMTLLHDRGELSVGDRYRTESVIGTRFDGRLLESEQRDGLTVTHPEVVGSAYITAKCTFTLDPNDPLTGFSLSVDE
jgi:proline racemase